MKKCAGRVADITRPLSERALPPKRFPTALNRRCQSRTATGRPKRPVLPLHYILGTRSIFMLLETVPTLVDQIYFLLKTIVDVVLHDN